MDLIYRCSGYELSDLEIVSARGSRLLDADGREWIDLEAGVWCAALGHNHPRLRSVIERQLNRISHIGYRVSTPPQQAAASELLNILEIDKGKCVFLSSGSEAVEFGVQVARRLRPQRRLLTLAESYLSAYRSSGEKTEEEWVLFDRTVCADCPQDQPCESECLRSRTSRLSRSVVSSWKQEAQAVSFASRRRN